MKALRLLPTRACRWCKEESYRVLPRVGRPMELEPKEGAR
jgi:hypothetical protein